MAKKMKVVVLVGGPTSATRFRPLSFDVPKPLVPIGECVVVVGDGF